MLERSEAEALMMVMVMAEQGFVAAGNPKSTLGKQADTSKRWQKEVSSKRML